MSKKNDTNDKNAIQRILDRLANYRDGEEGASLCLQEIKKSGDPKAWLILALVNLEEHKYQAFGTCLKNAVGGAPLDALLPEITEIAEHIQPYLEDSFCPLTDFIDGYLGRSKR